MIIPVANETMGRDCNKRGNMASLNKVSLLTGLRRMFYVLSPNETSFATPQEVPRYIDESAPFFFMFMILELMISLLKHDNKYRMNDAFTSMMAGMFSRIPGVLLRTITLEGYIWVFNHCCVHELPWNSAWTWWLTFLGADLAYYWFHRFAHEVNFMWAAHQVHHSSEFYNLSTALRQSVLQIYTSWVFYLPMALFVPPSIFIAHQELNILFQFWIHTEYIKSLGPLEYILNTPSHHRVHHGRNPYCIDKNYAGTLIIWDRLFGTFAKEEEEVAYGLVSPLNTFEPFAVQFGYGKYVLGRFAGLRGLGNKVKGLLYGPGWSPGKPRTGDPDDLPQVEQPVQRYNVKLPRWLSVYVFVHFFVILVAYQEIMARKAGLSQTSLLVFVVYSLLNLSCMGLICDHSPSARMFEILRCVLFLVGDIWASQAGVYGAARFTWVYGLQVFFALSAMLWLVDVPIFRPKPQEGKYKFVEKEPNGNKMN